ncbi:MAG: hypothetical protein ACREP7_19955 [Lysobacter sp.]
MSEQDGSPNWTDWAPAQGWDRFDAHEALSQALWSEVTEADGEWHHMSFDPLSIWEYNADGSAFVIEYRGDRIVGLQTQAGEAERYFLKKVAPFGLVVQAQAEPSTPAPAPG